MCDFPSASQLKWLLEVLHRLFWNSSVAVWNHRLHCVLIKVLYVFLLIRVPFLKVWRFCDQHLWPGCVYGLTAPRPGSITKQVECIYSWLLDSRLGKDFRNNLMWPLDFIIEDAQSCPTLCIPMDCSPPGSSVHGILQARLLVWVAIPFSKGSSRARYQTCSSAVQVDIPYCLSRRGNPYSRGTWGPLIPNYFFFFWDKTQVLFTDISGTKNQVSRFQSRTVSPTPSSLVAPVLYDEFPDNQRWAWGTPMLLFTPWVYLHTLKLAEVIMSSCFVPWAGSSMKSWSLLIPKVSSDWHFNSLAHHLSCLCFTVICFSPFL